MLTSEALEPQGAGGKGEKIQQARDRESQEGGYNAGRS